MNSVVLQTASEANLDSSFKAKVLGHEVVDLPKDLYIPPDALRIFLETFEGPLDLLLYLIKKQNIDILDIPIAEITKQYVNYVELMTNLKIELAAEYLLMSAMLAEIKSRMLLPRPPNSEEDEGLDPRSELVRRLQEYERFKIISEDLDELKRVDRDIYLAQALMPPMDIEPTKPTIDLSELLHAYKEVLERAELYADHRVAREQLSIRERMTIVLSAVTAEKFVSFIDFFKPEEGRMGVVVTLIAILELIRQSLLELVQSEPFAPIYVKAKNTSAVAAES